MNTLNGPSLDDLDKRSRSIFRQIVETYLASGEPVGSRNLSRILTEQLSPASIRNVMSDLEAAGLIYAPHTSAGRMPTETGLRFFVDTFLEVGQVDAQEQTSIERQLKAHDAPGNGVQDLLTEASSMLSGLSQGAGVVLAPKQDMRLKHVEFVRLEPTRALVVLVGENGSVENRLIGLPEGMAHADLSHATNYLNARLRGQTLNEVRDQVDLLRQDIQKELDALGTTLVDEGIATWAGMQSDQSKQSLIVRGRSNLLNDKEALADIDRLQRLLDDLESKRDVAELLEMTDLGEGVKIFIGSENTLFSLSGSSLVVAPYKDEDSGVVGALGVIGPTRLNYARIVPVVNYTAQLVTRLIGERQSG